MGVKNEDPKKPTRKSWIYYYLLVLVITMLINALVVALCLKRPEDVKKNLEMLEEAWNNYQIYLNDEINFIDEVPMLDYPLVKIENGKI